MLQPHRSRNFTFSPDPEFEPKLKDIVGLYLNPPKNALVMIRADSKLSSRAANISGVIPVGSEYGCLSRQRG